MNSLMCLPLLTCMEKNPLDAKHLLLLVWKRMKKRFHFYSCTSELGIVLMHTSTLLIIKPRIREDEAVAINFIFGLGCCELGLLTLFLDINILKPRASYEDYV
ncbi:hypothetical protein ACJX0J_009051, partial [Zea mays]